MADLIEEPTFSKDYGVFATHSLKGLRVETPMRDADLGRISGAVLAYHGSVIHEENPGRCMIGVRMALGRCISPSARRAALAGPNFRWNSILLRRGIETFAYELCQFANRVGLGQKVSSFQQ